MVGIVESPVRQACGAISPGPSRSPLSLILYNSMKTLSMKTLITSVLSLLLTPLLAHGQVESWNQFRGNSAGNVGVLSLPTHWSKTEGLAWATKIPGLGHSSPVHDGETIWLTTSTIDGKRLSAVAVAASTGEILHDVTVFTPAHVEEIHHDNSYASPTPVLSSGKLLVHFGTYGTACINTATADVLWRNNDFEVEHQGGPGSSPVVFENLVILTLDGANLQRVVALNISDGSVAWERKRSAPFRPNPITHRAFTTPLITTHKGQAQLISPAADQCHAYDPASGEERWHVQYVGFSTVPCPVANASRVFFCTGFFKPECWAVNLNGTGNVTDSHVAWKFKGQVPDTPSPLLVDDDLYIITNQGILTCIDAETGDRKWVFRVGGNYSASPMFANGLLYFCNEEGMVKVLDPRGEKPVILQINELAERLMASPAVVDSDLLIRGESTLFRISGTQPESNLP